MRHLIVYLLIALLYKVESRTYCDDNKCLCVNKENIFQVSCSSYPAVFENNHVLPQNVTSLDLSLNNLTRIPQPITSDTLIQLLLVRNQLKELTVDAFSLPSLKVLDLSHNNLEFIHRDTFEQIKNLEYLNLTNNKLNTFSHINFYHLTLLRELVFDDNNIGPCLENHSLFESGFELTDKIQGISLRNVNLTSKNKLVFADELTSLKKLDLAKNQITEIFLLPLNLKYLDISNNPIRNVSGDDFMNVVYLNTLKLNNILIEEVADFAFYYLTSLRNLELQYNANLRIFSPLAWGRIALKDQIDLPVESLNLRGANLTSLDGQMESIFRKIKRVDLRDNPWNCDCKLAWLQRIPIPDVLADFRCSTPQTLNNQRILEANSSAFICEEKNLYQHYVMSSTTTIILYCILLTAAVSMMYFFIFSPKFIYRKIPSEFPQTP